MKPTENTQAVLEDFNDIIERNRVFFRKVNAVNDDFAPMSLQKLLRMIYAMPWERGKGRTIADLPQRTPMLYP